MNEEHKIAPPHPLGYEFEGIPRKSLFVIQTIPIKYLQRYLPAIMRIEQSFTSLQLKPGVYNLYLKLMG